MLVAFLSEKRLTAGTWAGLHADLQSRISITRRLSEEELIIEEFLADVFESDVVTVTPASQLRERLRVLRRMLELCIPGTSDIVLAACMGVFHRIEWIVKRLVSYRVSLLRCRLPAEVSLSICKLALVAGDKDVGLRSKLA